MSKVRGGAESARRAKFSRVQATTRNRALGPPWLQRSGIRRAASTMSAW